MSSKTNKPVVIPETVFAQIFRDSEGFIHDFGAHFVTNRLAKAVSGEEIFV